MLFFYGDPLVPAPEPDSRSAEERVAQVSERFVEAARRQLLADVPIALMASGGVDSGLLWWATAASLERAYTISWDPTGDFEGFDDDRRAVEELERRFGTPVDYLPGGRAGDVLPSTGDLFADPAYDLARLIAPTARQRGHKVLLSGQGADEAFGGYRRHTMASVSRRDLRIGRLGRTLERALLLLPAGRLSTEYLARLARACSERDPFGAYMQLCTYSTAGDRAQALDCTEAEVNNEVVWQRHREVFDRLPTACHSFERPSRSTSPSTSPASGSPFVDRAGMEFGVEIQVPWLDIHFLRWALTLPDDALVHRGRGRWLTRALAASELSPEIAHRPKRGFAAPASRVGDTTAAVGRQGFRQGAYFARATRILDEHLVNVAGARPGPKRVA